MLQGKQLLVVDDSITIRKYLHNLLNRNGVKSVEEASTGQDALRLLQGGLNCDLMLLDLMLPDMDGIQLLQELRKFNDHSAVVMITGTGGIKTATMAVNQGADGYIDKQNLTIGNDPADFVFALEQALERREGLVAQKELQNFKADFYSMVTHDLRNPTGSIVLSTELLMKGEVGELTEEQKDVVGIAHNAALKLLNLVNNYLDFAKIEAGYLNLDFGEVEIGGLVQSSVQAARLQAQAKEQILEADLPSEPVMAEADDDRLKQVFDNLISNAIKYTPSKGRILVQMRVLAETQSVEFQIKDSGYGIPADQLPQLFTKYHRVPGQSTKSVVGTGLGLLIVKEIVNAHGGTVEVKSEGRDQGTTFIVTLPLKHPAAPAQ
jgi:signal transduction histidine kinase